MDNMNYRVCSLCQIRIHPSLYDLHMRTHALNTPYVPSSDDSIAANYNPFSSLVDFSTVLLELRQRQAQAQVNDNSTSTFPQQSVQQPPSAPVINPTIGISRLLELYSTISSGSTSTNANFLHNFDTITTNTSTHNLPSYRDVIGQQPQQPQQSQTRSSSAFYTHQQDTNTSSTLPTTAFQHMSYVLNPTTQTYDYTSSTYPQQPIWFSTEPMPPTTQSHFNLSRLGPIALDMLAVFDEALFDDYETNIRLAERVGVVEVGIDNIDAVSACIPKQEISADDNCTICLDKMIDKENERFRKLLCGHKYCDGCITQWLAKSKKCPVCNVDLQDKLHEVNNTQM